MKLTPCQLSDLLELAISSVEKAGELINKYIDKNVPVKSKVAGDSLASQVVTEVDLLVQKLILEFLEPSFIKYDLGLLTEELTDDCSRFNKDYFWCIDPLDGTLPFTEKRSGYSISVALVSSEGNAVLGVVYNPVTNDLYFATKGMGAYKNREPIIIADNENVTLICDRSFVNHEKYQSTVIKLKKETGKAVTVINHGGAVMNALWILEYAPAIYVKYPKLQKGGGSIWDYAATNCIFKELGLISTDFKGFALRLNDINTFMNVNGIIYSDNQELVKIIKSS